MQTYSALADAAGVVLPQEQVNAAVGVPFAQQVGATPEEDKVPLAVMAAANATPLRPHVSARFFEYLSMCCMTANMLSCPDSCSTCKYSFT